MLDPSDLDREARVLRALVSLVDTLLADYDVVEVLTGLAEQCAALLNVESTGVMIADPRGHLQLIAATSEQARDVEPFQLQSDRGPCAESYSTARPISVADVTANATRWPRFTAAAVDADFISAHAVPMQAAGNVFGALGLLGRDARSLGSADVSLVQTLAHIASVAILKNHASTPASVHQRLRVTLDSRVVIEQARGFLRIRLGMSFEEASRSLRDYAQRHEEHMTVVSQRLIFEPDARPMILAAMRRASPGPPKTQC